MRMDLRLVAAAQSLGEIALERGGNEGIVGHVGGEQLVVERDLRVREEHRALGLGESALRRAALGELLVIGQVFERAV